MSLFQSVADIEKRGISAAFCVVVETNGSTPRHSGSKMVVYENGSIEGTVGGGEVESRVVTEALQSIKDKRHRLVKYEMNNPEAGDPGVCGGQVSVYIEPIVHPSEIVVVGAGHVGKSVAHLAKWLGYRVVIVDDRPDLVSREKIEDGDEYITGSARNFLEQYHVTSQTHFVLTTRGTDVDMEYIPLIIDSDASYIGIIGSKRRWLFTRKALLELGISEAKLNSIHSPIGLELHAETPEEIAVSIMAEIIMIQRGGSGKEMSR